MLRTTLLATAAMVACAFTAASAQTRPNMPMPNGDSTGADSASAMSGMQSMHDRMQAMHDMMGQGHGGSQAASAQTCVASGPESGVAALLVGAAAELSLTEAQTAELEAILARTRADALALMTDEQRAKLVLAESADAPCTPFEGGGGMGGMSGGGMSGGGMGGGMGGGGMGDAGAGGGAHAGHGAGGGAANGAGGPPAGR